LGGDLQNVSKKSSTLNEDEAEVGNIGRGSDGSEYGNEDNDCDITTI